MLIVRASFANPIWWQLHFQLMAYLTAEHGIRY
jgi:hypothetical protein